MNLSKTLRNISPPKDRSRSPPRNGARIQITVLEAKDLTGKEKFEEHQQKFNEISESVGKKLQNVAGSFLSDDPFCKVTIGKETQKTSPKAGTLSPKWNETFIFENLDLNESIKIVIRDSMALYRGHFFGEVSIPLSRFKRREEVEEWFALQKRSVGQEVSGSVLLRINLLECPDPGFTPRSIESSTEIPKEEPAPIPAEVHPIDSRIQQQELAKSQQTNNLNRRTSIVGDSAANTFLNLVNTLSRDKNDTKTPSPPSSSRVTRALSTSLPIKIPEVAPSSSSSFPSSSPSSSEKEKISHISSSPNVHASSPTFTSPVLSPSNTSVDSNRSEMDSPTSDKDKNSEFTRKFHLPSEEILIKGFSCALHRNILMHGRLYVSANYVCFYSNLFRIRMKEVIPMKDITEITKIHKTISTGIQISTQDTKFQFSSFFSRDKTLDLLLKTWKKDGKADEKSEPGTEPHENDFENEEDEQFEDSFLTEEGDAHFLNSESSDFKFTELVNEELPVNLARFFRLFFSNESKFTTYYHEQRTDFEINVTEWQSTEKIGTSRMVSWRAKLNQPIGPKFARCQETQRYHLTKTKFVMESVTHTYDIPYGDTFRIENKWEVTPITPNSCRVVVYAGVYFMKKTFFRGKIESTSINAQTQSFIQWISLARKEIMKNDMKKSGKAANGQSAIEDNNSSVPTETPLVVKENPSKFSQLTSSLVGNWTILAALLLFLAGASSTFFPSVQTLVIVGLSLLVAYMAQQIVRLEDRISLLEKSNSNAASSSAHLKSD